MPKRSQDDAYSEAEIEKRFTDALKAGLTTAPKPLKEKPKVRKKKAKRKPPR